jgi:hypothetical protein
MVPPPADAGSPDAHPVHLTATGPPETILDAEPAEALAALVAALSEPPEQRHDAVASVVARWPRFLDAWARLGELGRDDIESYAYFRVGYHRGLDRLRGSGWRGSGFVRSRHETNRGFLRAVQGLQRTAAAIGEDDEALRCSQFLAQLDPGTA